MFSIIQESTLDNLIHFTGIYVILNLFEYYWQDRYRTVAPMYRAVFIRKIGKAKVNFID